MYSSQPSLNQLRLIYEISTKITSFLYFDELIEQVIELLQEKFGYSHIHFYTINPPDNSIIYQAGKIFKNKSKTTNRIHLNIIDMQDTVHHVFRNNSPLIVDDFREEVKFIPTVGFEEIRSELVVPLNFAGELLGILELQSELPNSFNEYDLFLMEALSLNIALALRNSNLYRSEKLRQQITENLINRVGILNADISTTLVLEKIINVVLDSLPFMVAAFWTMDEVNDDIEANSELRIAAIKGLSIDMEEGFDPEMIIGLSLDDLVEKYGLKESVKSLYVRSLESEFPITRSLEMEFEPLGAILGFDPNYSAISAPVKIGDKPLGILTLINDQPVIYSKDIQVLCSTLASYAAIVLQNSRLYESARDQAWISTVLFQVAEATQSIASVEDLLQTIVEILPDLIGINSCGILLWDDYIESFVPGAAYGLTSLQLQEFDNWYIAESDVPAFDKLRSTRTPVFLDHAMIKGDFDETLFSSFDFSLGLYVLFPMVSQSELIGAILVDFKAEDEENNGEITLLEEKISIIQGVANQTAVAIENLQLIQAQEEEAYVSIALLQVAQAIVSSNDLNEILSAIVRITPILVGIKRSVIFLWDEDQKIYRASQAYGFSREEISDMQPIYSPIDFPLLDWVRQNDKLVYYSMIKSLDPNEWANIDTKELSLTDRFSGNFRDDYQQQKILQSNFPLLMGFPLAVKGNVLGIMLVEEVDQSLKIPSMRIREKRFEIVTGISQQAALAIQNSILQRDVLERERLEREMQLAREIQNTFLPEHLPVINDWDIAVRWSPARQVGGDFYDIFELTNNKLGIIIADVADKGMPAALYMTLVRTLIRAAIQGQSSPREVLLRVNNLLVPDSRQGMFVTLVYAILSIDTGELVFANAGHNPPLSFKSTLNQISEHSRGSMALGVFHDIDIQESKIVLEQGDLMLFYTDGITEAFSSKEEMFGLERLKRILVSSNFVSASALLDQIEDSVVDFSEGTPQSDDLTLVAVYHKSY